MPITDFNLPIKTKGAFYVANPASHIHPLTPSGRYKVATLRTATAKDLRMSLSSATTEILDLLAEGYPNEDFEAVAEALGFTEAEIAKYHDLELTGKITIDESYFRTSLLACVMEAVIRHKGAVSIPAILQATEAQLPEWEEWYINEAKNIFAQQTALEKAVTTGSFADSPRWATLRVRFERQAELLSQVQLRLGRLRLDAAQC